MPVIVSYVSGSFGVDRGGCWYYDPQLAQVANRNYGTLYRRYIVLGVRLVRRYL